MTQNNNEITITEEESKICKLDNKKFDSNRKMIWHVRKTYNLSFEDYIIKAFYNDIRPVCLKTGKTLSFKAHKLGPWFSNYSKNCFPRKPHTEEAKRKIKEGCEKTSLEKFGVKNVFSTDWCKEKCKNTLLEKYGVENIMKTNEMKDLFSTFIKSQKTINQTKQTNLQKYGETVYTSTDECKLKMRKYNYDLHYKCWSKYIDQLELLHIKCLGSESDIINLNPLKFKCNICNTEWDDVILISYCKECEENFENCRSKEESHLAKWLKSTIKEEIVINKRFSVGNKTYEADIFIPSKNIIIELNGLFWHGERCGKDRNYHINKLNFLNKLGYRVIQIFEDEWLFKTDIVKSKLLHILGYNTFQKIYARNCIIKEINNNICNEFLDKTHLQGKVSATYCYGAYYNDELISVMSFSKPRSFMGRKNNVDDEYEMIRFSTDTKYRIIGIAGKLLNYFSNDIHPIKIISYADRRWTDVSKNVYDKLKFKLLGKTNPNYWYVKKYKREYRFNFTKQKLIGMGYDPNKTEKEIMTELGYDRIWDCGHLKYEYTSK
jgi:very-short-patch-repair endonuclease